MSAADTASPPKNKNAPGQARSQGLQVSSPLTTNQSKCAQEAPRAQVTVFSTNRDIGKRIDRAKDGTLVKTALATMYEASADRVELASLGDFMVLRESLDSHQALAYGLFVEEHVDVITLKARAEGKLGRPRSTSDMAYSEGPGIACLDYDPNGQPITPREWFLILIGVIKELSQVTMVWAPSGSSNIVDAVTNEQLTGISGQRMYFIVDCAKQIPRIVKLIRDRLILAGYGYAFVTKAGSVLVRTLVDPSVAGPEHLDFSTATCGPGLVRRPAPWRYFESENGSAELGVEWPARAESFVDLGPDEMTRLRDVERSLKTDPHVVERAKVNREEWGSKQARKAKPDATSEDHAKLAREMIGKVERHTLHDDHVLELEGGTVVTVAEVLASAASFHNIRCSDPLESGGDPRVAMIMTQRTNGRGPAIRSHLHGGYWLDLVASPSAEGFDDVDDQPSQPGGDTDADTSAEATGYEALTDWSDAGNANRLREITCGDLRFVPERGYWLFWNGSRWISDSTGALAQHQALRVAEFYLGEHQQAMERAKATSDEMIKKDALKDAARLKAWATKCRNRSGIDAMLQLASRDVRMVLRADDLDLNPMLLGVANGVVDLQTGQLRPAARDDHVTRHSRYAYRRGVPAPRWRKFIKEIAGVAKIGGGVGDFDERPLLVDYLHRVFGYCLTGSTNEHKMFIFSGRGANGKNIALDTVQEILGDNAVTIPPEALMATRHEGDAERPSPVTATLAGARMAISSESKESAKLDVALVKRHTGGGFMTARLMRENSFRFLITHKLILMTNHRPGLDHMDEALRGRLHQIPFDRIWNRPGHPDPDPALPNGDKDLMRKLQAESEGILAWLVEGAVAYHQHGLEPPKEVTTETKKYFEESDSLGLWIATMERCEAKVGSRASELFQMYRTHCASTGRRMTAETQTAFSLALKSRQIEFVLLAAGTFYGLQDSLAGL